MLLLLPASVLFILYLLSVLLSYFLYFSEYVTFFFRFGSSSSTSKCRRLDETPTSVSMEYHIRVTLGDTIGKKVGKILINSYY